MISNNGFTWTSKDETLEYHDKFTGQWGPAAANSAAFRRPACEVWSQKPASAGGTMVKYGCGETTTYMVFDENELKGRGRGRYSFLIAMGKDAICVFKADGLVFVPTPLCTKCEARRSGYRCAMDDDDPESYYRGVDKGPYTAEEAKAYRAIFSASYAKGRGARLVELDKFKKPAGRYTPKQQGAPL